MTHPPRVGRSEAEDGGGKAFLVAREEWASCLSALFARGGEPRGRKSCQSRCGPSRIEAKPSRGQIKPRKAVEVARQSTHEGRGGQRRSLSTRRPGKREKGEKPRRAKRPVVPLPESLGEPRSSTGASFGKTCRTPSRRASRPVDLWRAAGTFEFHTTPPEFGSRRRLDCELARPQAQRRLEFAPSLGQWASPSECRSGDSPGLRAPRRWFPMFR